ncbi:hypothetical protein IX91_26010 (plasmid) [Vibrio tubiashii ATCC 19109]|uniref:Relaxosome protein TraY n=1 Tax=Vibrio tubiashii ATCC 19109 TaxID=1051646 RepID=F9T6N9_9VIBR|nr:TraY domain-containing protein [Vibrio tubiashii]AIW17515.1 hypothetical protein IX91_26010 [Vibrio tubiashii ATCC 19109]EGU54444.1 hypothetical protein VITU9109_02682 [Vibrio tubiashii ATCC 19109]EIF01286.1 hypothetical protein VT1337_24410 [Vibrio tubiashii NCIMB 1337 = ATCC 19106]
MKNTNSEEQAEITVQVTLKGERARRFAQSVKTSGRSNRGEAKIRLEHSLDNFSSLAAVDHAVARN